MKRIFQRIRQWFRISVDREFKFWVQRRAMGFDNSDLWSLDVTLAEFILPRLKAFRDNHMSHPVNLTYDEWNVILDKMIVSFEVACIGNWRYDDVDEGFKLFGEYYMDLWD